MATQAITMEPLSARLPSDLYLWLAQLQVEGATTNSDKLRVLLGQLKRQHDGAFDYVAAHGWAREMTHRLREALVRIEGQEGLHSEVLGQLVEQVTTLMALVISAAPATTAEATRLEDALVRRAALLGESLLRQAITGAAHAFDPDVVKRHLGPTIELASTLKGA
ncbi:MAG: hypothetical protein EKK53_07495 [Burkholderiales bacterium]|nr:MAG: hypothetical protein EKK53_07495 [Burkholderiales bacterium]